jgi:RNA polymerase subunit RPABC4/transcription elongation factor Spt4
MSRFREELRVIPRTAWIISIVGYLTISTLILTHVVPRDPEMSKWPCAGKIAFSYGAFLLFGAAILLIGYVYGDAKRRGMRYIMWTWLALLIPDGIGIILYFILRSAVLKACPGCSIPLKSGFVFCPHCGTSLQPTCPQCGRGVEPGWANCPQCGTKLPTQKLQAA